MTPAEQQDWDSLPLNLVLVSFYTMICLGLTDLYTQPGAMFRA